MDHTYVEEHHVADRYLMGRLPEPEAAEFEEHYLGCPQCLDRLELVEPMQEGFKRVAEEDLARLAATRQIAVLAWLSRLGRSRQAAVVAMALVVAVLLPSGLLLRRLAERESELAAARSDLARAREESTAGSRTTAEAAETLRRQLDASRRALDGERRARAGLAEELERATRPQANVPIAFLNPERGAGEPSVRLRPPAAPGSIVLALEIDPPHHPAYRAVLRDPAGREVWRAEALRLNEMETLSLSLPSALLSPGDWVVTVEGTEGVAPGAAPAAGVRFAFRVLPVR
jgi:hypothetical protein